MVGLRWMLLVALTLTACSERVNLGEVPPRDEVYGTCESDADCAGDRCLEAAGGRLCTAMCGADVDPGACPDAADVGVEVGCLRSSGAADEPIGYCALLCTEDGQCPSGSSCKTFEGFTQTGVIETRFCAPT